LVNYFSQYSQDKFVNFLLNKKGGTFLDIGANDGITFSNSFFFEKVKGWKGICIEPLPEIFNKLRINRTCTCINCGIWKEKRKLQFYRVHGYAEMLSGIVESFHSDHFKRLETSIQQHGGKLEIIEINAYPLNQVLADNHLYKIDFCSIDTEGSEYEILKALDFTTYSFSLFEIENQFDVQNIRALMCEKGFKHIYRLGSDDFFLRKELYRTFNIRIRIFLFRILQKINSLKQKT
jgi:FkbM family methyltransferase